MPLWKIVPSSLYDILLYNTLEPEMRDLSRNDEIRWQVVKAMLDEFPTLKEKARKYLEGKSSR